MTFHLFQQDNYIPYTIHIIDFLFITYIIIIYIIRLNSLSQLTGKLHYDH